MDFQKVEDEIFKKYLIYCGEYDFHYILDNDDFFNFLEKYGEKCKIDGMAEQVEKNIKVEMDAQLKKVRNKWEEKLEKILHENWLNNEVKIREAIEKERKKIFSKLEKESFDIPDNNDKCVNLKTIRKVLC